MSLPDLLAHVDRIRSGSKLSAEYWHIRDRDGRLLQVFLCPPGDIVRLRQHYPGADGGPVSRERWMKTNGEE